MNIPELLAPVGSKEALAAAVQNGADAVYLGGKMFSARQYANNFERDELNQAFEYAHIRGVKVYVTVNTLLSDSEFAEAIDYLKFLHEAGADAIIVQDLGVASMVRNLLPGLALHASTQMTVHNSPGVELLKNQNFSRVVLARELSLHEISEIKKKTGMQLEIFVHGALCISYSGQCLMSSMIGGRSGNRGRCAQPCRMEYTLVDQKGSNLVNPELVGSHLLSPMDLNMIQHIPELARAGVDSLKIEGRMKRPEYVATVTRIYREALDRYQKSPEDYSVDKRQLNELGQIFNRGFTTGYFFGKQGKDMMSYKRPNNRGLRLGRVTVSDWAQKMVEITLEDTLRDGDGIEFWVTEGGRKGIFAHHLMVNGKSVDHATMGQKVWVQAEGKIRPGDRVFKTHDVELMALAEQSYKSSRELKRIPLFFKAKALVGQPFAISVKDGLGNSFTVESKFIGQEALNKALTPDVLEKQLDRLGNTPFTLGSLEYDLAGNIMVPASAINETRRQAIDGLVEIRAGKNKPTVHITTDFKSKAEEFLKKKERKKSNSAPVEELKLTIRVNSISLLKAAAKGGADTIYFGSADISGKTTDPISELKQAYNICVNAGADLVVSTPRIVREDEMKYVYPLMQFALEHNLPILVANLGTLSLAEELRKTGVFGDFPLNIYNSSTLHSLVEDLGLQQATLSPELTLEQIAVIMDNADIPVEAIIEGHLPLMVTEYCPQGSLLGNMGAESRCKHPCRDNQGRGLKDRLGLVFPLSHDEFCRTYIYNSKELSMIEDIGALYDAGISRFRIETSVEDPEMVTAVTRIWRNELNSFMKDIRYYQITVDAKAKILAMNPAGLTKGHYYRGVE